MAMDTARLEANAVLGETYQLTRRIGEGGMGTVWEAKHLRLPKTVAIKVLREAIDFGSEAFTRFRREAEIASRLGHPHIVEALDFNTLDDGSPYLVLEYLRGESLRDRIMRGPLPLDLTVHITRQVASALHAAHGQGVVHRDLKPENIFLCHVEGEDLPHAKVLDFGISKIQSAQTKLTQEGMIFGTPHYMAPEQAAGKPTGAAADQFALAAMVYEMLCGRTVFTGTQAVQVLYQVVHEQPQPLSGLAPHLPPAVTRVVDRGLAKDPAQRFPDVMSLARELAAAAGVQLNTPAGGLPADALAQTLLPSGSTPAVEDAAGLGSAATLASPAAGTPAAKGQSLALQPTTNAPVAPTGPAGPLAKPRGSRWMLFAALGIAVFVGAGIVATLATRDGPPAHHQPAPAAPPDAAILDQRSPDLAPKPDQRVPDSRKPPAPGPGKTRPTRTTVRPELLAQIKQAEQLLRGGRHGQARFLGERLQRELPRGERWAAHAILARYYCTQQDLAGVRAHLGKVPRTHRRAAVAFCKAHFPGFEP